MPEVRKLWATEGLFSDHYLKARLKKNDWWPSDADAQSVFQFCKELYEKRAFALRRYDNEMGVRQEFIDKILDRLGFAWSDNLRLPETDQDFEPDYILYPDGETKESVLNQSVAERYRAGVGILEAKKFGHSLSQISKSQQRYPHRQIREYLDEAQVLRWGILTNGNEWRLYCRDTKPSHFFAINFELAIRSLDDFKVFLALFSSAAFARDNQGKCRLDQVRENALATQAEFEADLRQRIFTIVEILANGFAERPENNITDADLPRLYENCLIFLYRLLFILYAEGRQLLPVEPRSRKYYKQLSLARLLAPLKNFTEDDSQTQTRFYRDIHALCLLINGTDKKANDEFGVPRYNGGLFDPDRCPLLKQWAVADAVLADVLRQLMFTPEKAGQKFVPFESVDYADLSVQQLGSIYEGLLEHHFVREDGRLVLQTDKAERKATGTYYTPDYIVKYIIEQTLTPLLREIEQREPVKTARAAGTQDNSFADAVLKLDVCDPAMGSGHFLVEATTFLADHIVYHPTTKFQEEFVKGESQEEAEIAYWRRRVVESCIYGVDLNPLAVELAKLSLWLTTISTDQPLNFLDHHLRCGNSLIGARLDQLGHLPQKKGKGGAQQIHFTFGPDFKLAVADTIRQIHQIEGQASLDMATVKAKEKRWELEILPRLAPYKRVADLWTNIFFDGPLSEEEYLTAAKQILVAAEAGADRLREAAARYGVKELDKPYFHWELEFPDVFLNDDGSPKAVPGFDAVVGNPPYGAISDKRCVPFVQLSFLSFQGNLENYALFMDKCLGLSRMQGRSGLIVPVTWCRNPQFGKLRSNVLSWCLEKLVELPTKVFSGSDLDTCIFMLCKQASSDNALTCVLTARDTVGEEPSAWKCVADVPKRAWLDDESRLSFDYDPAEAAIVAKLRRASVSLQEFFDFSQGLVPYARDEFYATMSKEEADRIVDDRLWHSDRRLTKQFKPELRGEDVERYQVNWNGKQWIKYGPWLARPREPRFFKGPRVLIQEITRGRTLRAGFTNKEYYHNPGIIIVGPKPAAPRTESPSLLFLVAVCNSALFFFWHTRNSPKAKLVTSIPKILVEDVARLPVRRIQFTTPPAKRAELANQAKRLYERAVKTKKPQVLLDFVADQLSFEPCRSDAVHDLLAFLAKQMAILNRSRSKTIKQFLTDLWDFYGIKAQMLTPKTTLEQFWELDADQLFAHLRANSRVLASQKVRLTPYDEEKIRTRFQKAKDQIVPLESSLAFTDDLIDEIIYRLYGLTPDEIRVVKEASK